MRQVFTIYKKTDKSFFPTCKNVNRILSKKQRVVFQKRLVKGTKISLKKINTKGANLFVSDIEIILKKKTKRSVNKIVSNLKIF